MVKKINLPNPVEIGNLVDKLNKLSPGEYVVEVVKNRSLASQKQRGYYHGILILAIAVHLGYEKEEVHTLIKEQFNPKEVADPFTGEVKTIGGSTSRFDTKKYTELIDWVRAKLLPEIRLDVPPPQEVTTEYAKNLKFIYENRFN